MKRLTLLFSVLISTSYLLNAQWEFQNPIPSNAELNNIFFIDSNHGWAVGNYLTILYTDDGGNTWSEQLSAEEDSYYQFSNLYDVHFTDLNHGWAVGQFYMPYGGGLYGLIFHTEDGGETWVATYPVGDYFNFCDVHFSNGFQGWVIDEQGKIIYTNDNGITWIEQFNDESVVLNSMSFSDEQNGLVVGNEGLILKTSDGGSSWFEQESGYSNDLNSVCFTSSTTGWISERGYPAVHPRILKTIDGGENWEISTNIPYGPIGDMYFLDSLNGWITYTIVRELTNFCYVHITHDGGQTWDQFDINYPVIPYSSPPPAVYFNDLDNGWIVAENIILKSTNSGEEWIAQNAFTDINLFDVWFADENNGWAVGQETYHLSRGPNIIMHTYDGGNTWSVETGGYFSDTTFMTVALSFIDSQNGWVLGSGSPYHNTVVMKTPDGGHSWSLIEIPYPLSNDFSYDIQFTDLLNGWVLFNGKILHSDDGGESWNEQFNAHPNGLFSFFFHDNQTGWVVGYGSDGYYIFKTNNGGENWNGQILDTVADSPLNCVFFINELLGWVVGQNQVIYHTYDGGQNWHSQFSECSCSDYQSVYFINESIGWIVGETSGSGSSGCQSILYTNDGGESWTEQFFRPYGGLNAVHFIDSNIGWVVGEGGTVIYTDNGGTVDIENSLITEGDQMQITSYPNPFSISTIITYELHHPSEVTIHIYNQLGELVDVIEQHRQQGKQQITWNAEGLPDGIYYFRLQAGEQQASGKVVLVR